MEQRQQKGIESMTFMDKNDGGNISKKRASQTVINRFMAHRHNARNELER